MHGSYNLQLDRWFTTLFEIPVDQVQERGYEAIRLHSDSGVFIFGESTINETLGSIE